MVYLPIPNVTQMMKHLHRMKRRRDKNKTNKKLLKNVDAFVLTKHAVARANERFVSLQDIKRTLKKGNIERTSSKTFRIKSTDTVIVVAKNKEQAEQSYVAILTTWKTWRKKKNKQK